MPNFFDSIGGATGLWGKAPGMDPYKKYENLYGDIPLPDNADIEKQYQQQAPEGRAAQMAALQGFTDLSKTGQTAQDVAANSQMLQRVQGAQAAANKAAQANAASRGMASGGGALASNLANASDSSQIANLASVSNAANAQNARMAALGGLQNTGSSVRQGDINQAAAANEIRNFNFKNALAKAAGQSGAYSGQAESELERSKKAERTIGNMFSGGAQIAAAAMSDERCKTNIEPMAEEMMDNIKPYNFEYKNPEKHGMGRYTGVMAQDLEKSDMGKSMVGQDEEGTKNIDIKSSSMAALAGIADLHERLKKLEAKNG